MDKVKVGRPLGQGAYGISTKDRKAYDKVYRQSARYIFTVNLSQEKDADIIEALESYSGGNRQKALKCLVRIGINTIMGKTSVSDLKQLSSME